MPKIFMFRKDQFEKNIKEELPKNILSEKQKILESEKNQNIKEEILKFNYKIGRNQLFEKNTLIKSILRLLCSNEIKNDVLIHETCNFFNEMVQSRNEQRKLNDLFPIFLFNEKSLLKIKKLIWAVFIYCRCKLISMSQNLIERFEMFLKVLIVILNKVPNPLFPSAMKINKINKLSVIKEVLREKTKFDFSNFSFEEIEKQLPSSCDFNSDENVQSLIDSFYQKYEDEFINEKLVFFDERILFLDLFNTNVGNSPIKVSNFSTNKQISCGRQLVFDKVKKSSFFGGLPKQNAGSIVNITPITRAVNFANWAKNYITEFKESDYERIEALQKAYSPSFTYNPQLNPFSVYIENKMNEFQNLLNFHKTRVVTLPQSRKKFCLKLISILFVKEEMLFTDNFNAMLLYNEDFIKAIITLSLEMILFVEEVDGTLLNQIAKAIGLDMYDLWKALNPCYLHLLISRNEIKEYLEEVEYQIISFLIWMNSSEKFKKDLKNYFNTEYPEEIKSDLEKLMNQEYNNQSLFLFHNKSDFETEFVNHTKSITLDPYKEIRPYLNSYKYLSGISVLLQRLLYYCNLLNKSLFDKMKIEQVIAIESESLIKRILTNESYISVLYENHIDQIILCCVITILQGNDLFETTQKYKEIEYREEDPKINIKTLQDYYVACKPRQLKEVSNMIFNRVTVSEGNYYTLIDYCNKKFKIDFQEIIHEIISEHDDNSTVDTMCRKKRKISNNREQIILSSGREKVDYNIKENAYAPLKKQVAINETKHKLYDAFINEFQSKRTIPLQKLYYNIMEGKKVNRKGKDRNALKKIYSEKGGNFVLFGQ